MRGILLCGGRGHRMSPATQETNKHLLPVYSNNGAVPMIYYPLQTLVQSGITEILVVSSREHCGRIIETLSDGHDFGADLSYKIQDTSHVHLGIASALKLAKGFTKDEKFAVILGDNFFEDVFTNEVHKFNTENHKVHLFLKEVTDIHRFGCATVDKDNIVDITEKPKNPESNWAVTGLYFYTPDVYEIADTLVVSRRGELEVTDLNANYCKNGMAKACFLSGWWSDMGTPASMLQTEVFMREKIPLTV